MFRPRSATPVDVRPDQVVLGGGVDMISPPGFAKPGTCRFSINYEQEFGGGYRRVGGFERFDGRFRPHLAQHVVIEGSAGFGALAVGAIATGSVSGAEGKVIWISPDGKQVAFTRMLPGFSFEFGEDLMVGVIPMGAITNPTPSIDSFLDNDLAWLAAEEYRQDIQKPPGDGPILGVAVIDDKVFAWRDDGGAKRLWKSTITGWAEVDLGYLVFFDTGTTAYLDGGSVTQGGVSAIIKRVVVTEGSWIGGDALGYLVIDQPVGGSFVAGLATGSGACTLSGPETQQTLAAGGRVEVVQHNFYGSDDTKRLYGCDGNNNEFEFDGEVWVPLFTGMGTVHASHVFVHKNHLFFAFGASLQHSGVADPYRWQPLFGAGELMTGDPITNLINVAGSEENDALMVTCRDSVWVLYGNSAVDWDFNRISDDAGAQAYSGVSFTKPIAFDRNGFNQYSPTDAFGNFGFDSASRQIEPLVSGAVVKCSVLAKDRSRYRCFFSDGLFLSATPVGRGLSWMPCDYGRTINVAFGAEIQGTYRVFMGDTDGWVLEADVGRSFDGGFVEAGVRLSSLNQRSSVLEKQYRHLFLQTTAASAYRLACGAEYSDHDPESAAVTNEVITDFKKQYGAGLFWSFNSWDEAYWDGAAANRPRYDIHGKGQSISLLFQSNSDREMPHELKTVTVMYTPRRLGR